MMQAHVVNAFEKSLATMTNRLQSLTAATEKKVCLLRTFLHGCDYFSSHITLH